MEPSQDANQPKPARRRWIARLAIALASAAATALVFEVAATWHLGERFVRGAELGNSWKSAGQRDAQLGWRGRPGVETRIVDGQLDYTVQLNSEGYRDPERSLAKPGGVQRVVALGDSVTWGWGVQEGERFTDLLEARLGPNVEVLNLAMPGYGTDQHYWTLIEAGLAYQPDVVLLCFVLNDIPEAEANKRYGMDKPRMVRTAAGDWVVEGRPVAVPARSIASWSGAQWQKWTTRSALLTLATGRALDPPTAASPADEPKVRYRENAAQTPEPVKQAADRLTQPRSVSHHALTLIRDACAERGIRLLITHVPHKHDQYLYEPRFPAPKDLGKRPFRSYVSRRLAQFCRSSKVPFLPVDDVFLETCRSGTSLHVGDGHPNAIGHRLIADVLGPGLSALLKSDTQQR